MDSPLPDALVYKKSQQGMKTWTDRPYRRHVKTATAYNGFVFSPQKPSFKYK